MAIDFSPPRIVASLGLSGLSLIFLRNAKLDDAEVAERLTEKGHDATEEAINTYRHRSIVYAAVAGALSPLAYVATKEQK